MCFTKNVIKILKSVGYYKSGVIFAENRKELTPCKYLITHNEDKVNTKFVIDITLF